MRKRDENSRQPGSRSYLSHLESSQNSVSSALPVYQPWTQGRETTRPILWAVCQTSTISGFRRMTSTGSIAACMQSFLNQVGIEEGAEAGT